MYDLVLVRRKSFCATFWNKTRYNIMYIVIQYKEYFTPNISYLLFIYRNIQKYNISLNGYGYGKEMILC